MKQALPKHDIHPCWGAEGWLVYATRRGSHLNTHHGLQRGVLVLQPRRLRRGGAGVLLVVVDWQPLRHSLYVLPQRRDRLPDQEQHYQPRGECPCQHLECYFFELQAKVRKDSRSWRRPLHRDGGKCLLALSHLMHYKDTMLNRC